MPRSLVLGNGTMLATFDDFLQMRLFDLERRQQRGERQRDRVFRFALVYRGGFGAPPRQLGARDAEVGAFIDDVINFATVRIKRSDRTPPQRRQEQKAVVKA